MSAKCFSEQFAATSLICSTSASLSLKKYILIDLLVIYISLLKCFLLFPLLSWLLSLSLVWLHQTITEPQDWENGEEGWGFGRTRPEAEQNESKSSLSVLVSVPFSALHFYHHLTHGYDFGSIWNPFPALKKERTSLMTSGSWFCCMWYGFYS